MTGNEVIKKITEILSLLYIESEPEKLDQERIIKIVSKFEKEIRASFKKNNEIEVFLKKKQNFPKIDSLKEFATKKLKIKLTKTKRIEIEEEIVQICINKQYSISDLEKKYKNNDNSKVKNNRIKNQVLNWFKLSDDQLNKDLDDKSKYPSVDSLKQAADNILSPKQKSLKTRKSLIAAIIKAVRKEKAFMQIGS